MRSFRLRDLDGFSHIHLIFWLLRACPPRLTVKPILDDANRGGFATWAPCRPNPIGVSVVRLVKREANVLHLEDVDILDGTPLLDIKPCLGRFDYRADGECDPTRGAVRKDSRYAKRPRRASAVMPSVDFTRDG
ncbi:MAG: SAM-dependent methyltransferase [Planctomycetota bacterium]